MSGNGGRCSKRPRIKSLHALVYGSVLFNLFYWNIDVFTSLSSTDEIIYYPYATMTPLDQMDFSSDKRISFEQKHNSTNCNDVLLFMPYAYSINGQGAQLNSFIHASLLATFLDKPLIVMEALTFHIIPDWAHHMPHESLYESGSQFGCPAEYFNSNPNDFPPGLSRLIQIPSWINKGCGVPTCNGKFAYHNWEAIRRTEKIYWKKHHESRVTKCTEGDQIVNVAVAGGAQIRRLFLSFNQKMLDRSTEASRKAAFDWALRLGASSDEAQVFSSLSSHTAIWDYLSALINRSGLLQFQPWIARDVEQHILSSNFPLDQPYSAIHVRRGDKLLAEAKSDISKYWQSKGYTSESSWPTNYIPFARYLEVGWNTKKCKGRRKNPNLKLKPTTVYVATDDPSTVSSEIEALPKSKDGYTLINTCGDRANLTFSPSSKIATSFHINDRGDGDDCHKVYERNIAAIADMIILTRATKLVADFNSNWGRFIRNFRLFIDNQHHVSLRDMVSAFGQTHPGSPGS